jgi:hypothetical protein
MAVTHRSLSIASEISFGSLVDGIPSYSGLSWTSIPCERDPIVIAGEPVVSERNDARDGAYFVPSEPDTVWSGSSRVRRRTGQIVCRVDLTTIGSTPADYSSNYLGLLLGAGFLTQIPSAAAKSDTPSAVTNANTFTPSASYSESDIGTLISTTLSGRAEYSAVTDHNVTGDVTISPAFSASSFTAVRGLQTWYTPSRATAGTYGNSVAFRIDGNNFRSYAYGCVLETLNITLDNGRLMAEFTFNSAFITDDHSNAAGPVEPSYNDGAAPFFRGAYTVISDDSPASLTNATIGETLGRIALDCEDFSLTVTNTLTPLGHSNSVLAMSDMEISDVAVELSLTLSTVNTAIANDFFNRKVRQVIIGTGPQGDGKGCAIMLPAGMLTVDPSAYDVSGNDIVRQQLTYQQSRYAGDYSSDLAAVYESNAGCSPFRIGLGV